MSTKPTEKKAPPDRESFLRRLEENNANVRMEDNASGAGDTTVDAPSNLPPTSVAKSGCGESSPTQRPTDEGEAKPPASLQRTKTTPAPISKPSFATSKNETERSSSLDEDDNADDEDRATLEYLASCGLPPSLADLKCIDRSSLELLRTLSTPRLKGSPRSMSYDPAPSDMKTAHVGNVPPAATVSFNWAAHAGATRPATTTRPGMTKSPELIAEHQGASANKPAAPFAAAKGSDDKALAPSEVAKGTKDSEITDVKISTSAATPAKRLENENGAEKVSSRRSLDFGGTSVSFKMESENEIVPAEGNQDTLGIGKVGKRPSTASTAPPPLPEIAVQRATLQRYTSDLTALKIERSVSAGTEGTTAGLTGTIVGLPKEDYANLEPWQKALFEMMESQRARLERLEGKIDDVRSIIAATGGQQQQWQGQFPVQGSQPPQSTPLWGQPLGRPHGSAPPTPPAAPQTPRALDRAPPPPLQPQQLPQPQPQLLIFPILTSIVSHILSVPQVIYNSIKSSFPIRLISALRAEAKRRNLVDRFFDGGLIIKLVIACVIFGGRASSRAAARHKKNGGGPGSAMGDLWDKYRLQMFVVGAVGVYLVQTGLLGFLYDFFVRDGLAGKVWRNKEDEENGESEERADGLAGDGAARRRRGQLDRAPVGEGAADRAAVADQRLGGPPHPPAAGAGDGAGAVVAAVPPPPPGNNERRDRTLAEGGIRPRRNRQGLGVIVGYVTDMWYLVGSFALSLLPTWKPEAVVDPAAEEANGEGGVQDGGAATTAPRGGGAAAGGALNDGNNGAVPAQAEEGNE